MNKKITQKSTKILSITLIMFFSVIAVFAILNVTNKNFFNHLFNKSNTDDLAQSIETLIQQSIPNSPVGIVLQDANSGKILYSRRASEAFLPASTTKLFTAAAALIKLGEDYKITTTFKAKRSALQAANQTDKLTGAVNGILKGDLYIQFAGDPSFTTEDLKKMVALLKTKGIHSIEGNVILNTQYFQKPDYALGITQDALAWYYAAPISSIIINGNKTNLNLSSNPHLGNPAKIEFAFDENIRLPLSAQVLTVSEEDANNKCQIQIQMDEKNNLSLRGCWPLQEKPANLKVAIKNPELLAEKLILDYLKAENIKLNGKVVKENHNDPLEILVSHNSPPLKELLKGVLQDSNNTYADSILKTLGVVHFQQGSFHLGVLALQDILKPLGLDFNQVRLFDGSGLSRYNLITPLQMSQLLRGIYQNKPLFNTYRHLLAEPGISGTLKAVIDTGTNKDTKPDATKNTITDQTTHQTTDPITPGSIQAKTGALHGVSSLAGYLRNFKQEDLIFVIMIDDSLIDHKTMREFQLEFCRLILKQS